MALDVDASSVSLTYPLDLYYPDGVPGIPSDEEQAAILEQCQAYAQALGRPITADDPHPCAMALRDMLEKLRQFDYFEGVRAIVNALLSGHRTPEELFRALFPEQEVDVDAFTCQFADACDLILIREQIDWDRMHVIWFDAQKVPGI